MKANCKAGEKGNDRTRKKAGRQKKKNKKNQSPEDLLQSLAFALPALDVPEGKNNLTINLPSENI